MKNNLAVMVLVVLLAGAGGFFAGLKYQQTKFPTQGVGRQFNRLNGQQGRLGGAVLGEVISKDDNSITVKLPDGSSKIVLISAAAIVSKTDTASRDDLKTGERVAVFGTENSDGSITAQNVQLNPMFRMGRSTQGSPSGVPR